MLFNSAAFAVFFPVVVLAYYGLPRGGRVPWLLLAGVVFYGAFVPQYLLILAAIILIDYVAGRLIERLSGRAKLGALVVSIVMNLGVLFFFKYWNFSADVTAAAAALMGLEAPASRHDWILPIGLSFHTFQSLSYTIDVYRGICRAERSLSVYALYVLYFPQLVAGPIERPNNLLPQLHALPDYRASEGEAGLRLMAWGFFKKLVVADRLAVIADVVYGDPIGRPAPALILATVAFAFQIYADFSGYSDIALGASRVLGIRLMRNFNAPYLATSVSDFWRRWHISLSSWFRDYVYIPLGGNRVGEFRQGVNVFVTFLLSGLWHGANWTFVIWGALHGGFVLIERIGGGVRGPLVLRRCATFALVSVAWIFFRAQSVGHAWYILTESLFRTPSLLFAADPLTTIIHSLRGLGQTRFDLAVSGLAVAAMLLIEALPNRIDLPETWAGIPSRARWAAYYAVLASILALGRFGNSQFIYFQF